MGRILRRPAARQDLIDIYIYIAGDAPMRAGPFLERIDEKLRMLSDHPGVGTAGLSRFPDVRVFPLGNYMIIYRPLPNDTGIELIRVFHGARDWQRLFADEQ